MRVMSRIAVLAAGLAMTTYGLAAVPSAGAAPVSAAGSASMTALINADSVTTADGIVNAAKVPISLEQFAAQKLGYKVTVVTGAQWDAMTAAQFAHYQLLIVGDPFCSSTPASVTSDASVWAPVVMAKVGLGTVAGNRTLVGTDPEDHYAAGGGGASPTNPADPTTAGAEHLVQDGISFAGEVRGATGIYFDTSCADPGSDISVLNRLTVTGPGHWTENTSPPCGGSVSLIAANPAFNTGSTILTDANIQGWGCSDHITFPSFPADWDALAVATDTSTKPTCGTDPDTHTTQCGQAYVLIAGQNIKVTSPNLSLTPAVGNDVVGATHTVTAKVTHNLPPVALSGDVVTFVVTGQNAGVSGTCTTGTGAADPTCASDSKGLVRFTYRDTKGAGTDVINASALINGSTQHATATEIWGALGNGMMLLGGDGGMFAYGNRGFVGTANFGGLPGPLTTPSGQVITTPFVGLASTPDRLGYWDVTGNGQLFAVGHATNFGGLTSLHLTAPISGIAGTHDGKGYWMVGRDGGVFGFGDAAFHGSLPAGHVTPAAPIVGIVATPSGNGYWLVGADGGVFTFGDAAFHGSLGALHLAAPIVDMVATHDGGGYLMAAADGGAFAFGDSPFFGSSAGLHLAKPVVAVAFTSDGRGYWEVGGDGGIFTHGDAPFLITTGHGVSAPLTVLAPTLRAPIVGSVS